MAGTASFLRQAAMAAIEGVPAGRYAAAAGVCRG